MDKDDSILLIRCINNKLKNGFGKLLEMNNLTFSQGHILGYLFKNSNKTIHQNDIEKTFELKNSTVSGILKRLEKSDYIYRTSEDEDGRYKCIKLTSKAIDLEEKLRAEKIRVNNLLLSGIEPDERNKLNELLIKIYQNIENI